MRMRPSVARRHRAPLPTSWQIHRLFTRPTRFNSGSIGRSTARREWIDSMPTIETKYHRPPTYSHRDPVPPWGGGVISKPIPAVSVYGMYGTSFDPSAEGLSLSAATAALAPERSHTVETGLKWDPNAHLLLSGAMFRTVMSNLREPSPTDPTIQILAGTARSQGIEVQAQGYLTADWLILVGNTYMDASILSSPNGDRGSQLQNAPRENLRLFSAYDLTDKLAIGGVG